tara:strand:+ start:195 stop:578 length:384 start_codon:yes stop_codon:yes gene_type:complete
MLRNAKTDEKKKRMLRNKKSQQSDAQETVESFVARHAASVERALIPHRMLHEQSVQDLQDIRHVLAAAEHNVRETARAKQRACADLGCHEENTDTCQLGPWTKAPGSHMDNGDYERTCPHCFFVLER